MEERPTTVLVASVGTTPEPIIQAVADAEQESPLTLFLVYGRAFPEQEPDPFSVAQIISQEARELGVKAMIFELDEPENIDKALQLFRTVMSEASRIGADRVLLDFTGGTKVMAAAMVYVALSERRAADIVLEYVGGPRNENGRVKDMQVRRSGRTVVQELASRVFACLQEQEYTRALYLCETLPGKGKAGFLKRAALTLWHWDNFHYDEANHLLEDCHKQAKVLNDDADYAVLADTVVRLHRVAGRIALALQALEQLRLGSGQPPGRKAIEGHLYILGDVIENARRQARRNPTESVLRSYRAVEVATQIGVTSLGMNPWHPDWEGLPKEQVSRYLDVLEVQSPPRTISLWNGLVLLEILTSPFDPETKEDLSNIMTARNYSYLEHGYDKVSLRTAERIQGKMEKVVTAIASKVDVKKDPLQCAEEVRLKV